MKQHHGELDFLEGAEPLCGVDEVGRGPLAGPVVAAAAIRKTQGAVEADLTLIRDSKALSGPQRQRALRLIETHFVYSLGWAEPDEIDRLNILQATLLAMRRAVAGLPVPADQVHRIVVDGPHNPGFDDRNWPVQPVIKADGRVLEVSAASIVAKEHRDALMARYDAMYPGYGFAQHSGYGVPAHLRALQTLGPCPIHRRSFAPVKRFS